MFNKKEVLVLNKHEFEESLTELFLEYVHPEASLSADLNVVSDYEGLNTLLISIKIKNPDYSAINLFKIFGGVNKLIGLENLCISNKYIGLECDFINLVDISYNVDSDDNNELIFYSNRAGLKLVNSLVKKKSDKDFNDNNHVVNIYKSSSLRGNTNIIIEIGTKEDFEKIQAEEFKIYENKQQDINTLELNKKSSKSSLEGLKQELSKESFKHKNKYLSHSSNKGILSSKYKTK